MTGHAIEIVRTTLYRSGRTVYFRCGNCDLKGSVYSRPPETAEQLTADIIAVHWGATGGDS